MFPFRIAWRFLRSGSLQTVLIIVGISIAISVQVFVGLLIVSLQRSLIESTIGTQPQITIRSAGDVITIRDWPQIVSEIETLPAVDVISVAASGNAFVAEDNSTLPVVIQGFELESADRIYQITESIYQGSTLRSRNEVLIGRDLQEELEVNVGERLPVLTTDGETSNFTIAGFYDLGVASINETWIIADLTTAQRLFGYRNRITSIGMTVTEERLFDADIIAAEIANRLDNDDLEVLNWKDQNEQLLSGLQGQTISSNVIQGVVLASVVIAISSILSITVMQKSRQIGILKAMGIKDRDASLIFLYQGFLVGLIGSSIGTLLGLGLLSAFVTFTTSPGGEPLFEIFFGLGFIVRSWLIALGSATLAGLIPARRSLRLNPVDVIREG
jgi:lipoprotein-releasing system permease protein